MKIESVDDPTGQIGFYLKQLSDLCAEMDDEVNNAVNNIEQKYQQKFDTIKQLIESTRSLLS